MKEIKGDIWDFHKQGNWITVTVNGFVKKTKEAVMGKGIALQAKLKFPNLPTELGLNIQTAGNRVYQFPQYKLFTVPTKHNWFEKSDIKLIEKSCQQLIKYDTIPLIYCTRFGCGNGKLDWKDVKEIMEFYLDDRYLVVDND